MCSNITPGQDEEVSPGVYKVLTRINPSVPASSTRSPTIISCLTVTCGDGVTSCISIWVGGVVAVFFGVTVFVGVRVGWGVRVGLTIGLTDLTGEEITG